MTASAAAIVLATSALACAQTTPSKAVRTGYADIDGLHMYYEVHGAGEPLIVLHGGLGSTATLEGLLPVLSKARQVIVLDLQAHGRTADSNRPIAYEALADDVAALMTSLGIEKADVMGYSLGGGTALQVAIRHPAVVRKLIIVSTVFKRDGWYPEVLAAMAQMGPAAAEQMKPSPIYQTYARVAPRPNDWPVLVTKVADLLKKDYDWSRDVATIKSPTLLIFGDADAIRPQHIVEFFGLLGGGKKDGGWDNSGLTSARLAVLPGTTHYNILQSALLPSAVLSFLDVSVRAAK